MTRAEEAAERAVPFREVIDEESAELASMDCVVRSYYRLGYEQAEKDTIQRIREEIDRRMNKLYDELPDSHLVMAGNITIEQSNTLGKYTEIESLDLFLDTL